MTPRHPIVAQDLRDIESRLDGVLGVLEGRSVVITGATGMLAGYLSETIAHLNETRFRRPCRLTAIVRSLPIPDGPLGNLLSAPGVRFLQHDARTAPREIEEADYLILAACKGSPRHYLADPIGTLELSGGGLSAWLELARRVRSESVLYFSSGEIYGTPEPDAVPTPETYVGRIDPVAPRSVYAEGKRYGETLALAYQRRYGVPVKIVRPFQVFGPGLRSDDGRAFPDFVCSAAERRPLVLRSSGAALRTFMYIADATVAFWHVLIQGRPGCVYNVGSPGPELTIHATAERIAAIAGPGCRVDFATAVETTDAPARTLPDIRRLENDFGFAPRYGFDELVVRTLRWLREPVEIAS